MEARVAFDGRLLSGVTILVAIIESGSFARAAEALGLSPSGVSRAMARLEERLGVRLLERNARVVSLTDDGRRFYEQVGPLLVGLEDAASSVAGGRQAVRGRLRVNVDPYFSRLVLAPHLATFTAQYPELAIEIFTHDEIGDLVGEGLDVAVHFGEPRHSALIARQMLRTRILTVAAPDYITNHGRPGVPMDLVRHACIQFRDPATGRPFGWEFHRPGEMVPVPTTGALLLTDVGTMLGVCLAGAGIAQVMAIGVQDLLREGRLVELFPDWPGESFPLYAYYPSRRHPPAKVRAFIDFCLSVIPR